MDTFLLYTITMVLFVISLFKSKDKTKRVLKLTKESLQEILPKFLSLFLIIILLLMFINQSLISQVLGKSSGLLGIILAGILGSITLIPTVIAYPLAGGLLKLGAGYAQITMFITTLTAVGLITIKIESDYLGKKVAILRNGIAFIFAFIASILVSLIMI